MTSISQQLEAMCLGTEETTKTEVKLFKPASTPGRQLVTTIELDSSDWFQLARTLASGMDDNFRYAEVTVGAHTTALKASTPNQSFWLPADLIDEIDLQDKQQNPLIAIAAKVKFKARFSDFGLHVDLGTTGTILREFCGFWIVEDDLTKSLWQARTCELEVLESIDQNGDGSNISVAINP
ncbi:MAG TPA: hypothetical protein V6D18_08925 [Thermosynechococcaceae cyanobacterium]